MASLKATVARSETEDSPGMDVRESEDPPIVKLPWIPGISNKLKKSFKKAGFRAVFKSGNNLATILTARNKCKLPKNSNPGIYSVKCSCGKNYTGETKLQVATRVKQHQKNCFLGNTGHSGLCNHESPCDGDILWEEANTIKVEPNYYERKIREALEIQRNDTVRNGCNQDASQYMNNEFWLPIYKKTAMNEININNRQS